MSSRFWQSVYCSHSMSRSIRIWFRFKINNLTNTCEFDNRKVTTFSSPVFHNPNLLEIVNWTVRFIHSNETNTKKQIKFNLNLGLNVFFGLAVMRMLHSITAVNNLLITLVTGKQQMEITFFSKNTVNLDENLSLSWKRISQTFHILRDVNHVWIWNENKLKKWENDDSIKI